MATTFEPGPVEPLAPLRWWKNAATLLLALPGLFLVLAATLTTVQHLLWFSDERLVPGFFLGLVGGTWIAVLGIRWMALQRLQGGRTRRMPARAYAGEVRGEGAMQGAPFLFGSLGPLIAFARVRALRGLYNGKTTPACMELMRQCAHQLAIRPDLCAGIIFTRDAGHHSSGWWKNPDYERCWHLSISFLGMPGAIPVPFEKAEAERIAQGFFGDHARWCWVERPYSPEGKARDVWHYRLFCDPSWAPIQPRGEVYSKEATPADWRSFSEIHGYQPALDQAPFLLAASM